MLLRREFVYGSRKLSCPFLGYKDTFKDIWKSSDALYKREGIVIVRSSDKGVFTTFVKQLTSTEKKIITKEKIEAT